MSNTLAVLLRPTRVSLAVLKLIEPAAHNAATSPFNLKPQPTAAQIAAGNYRLGHIKIGPLDISIENPAHSVREDKHHQPPQWKTVMESHYGYILGTTGKDKSHLDCFVRPNTPEDYVGPVHVIDQTHKDGIYDEHKCLIGWQGADAAERAYLSHYEAGWQGLGALTTLSFPEFLEWLQSGNTTEALAYGKMIESHDHKHLAPAIHPIDSKIAPLAAHIARVFQNEAKRIAKLFLSHTGKGNLSVLLYKAKSLPLFDMKLTVADVDKFLDTLSDGEITSLLNEMMPALNEVFATGGKAAAKEVVQGNDLFEPIDTAASAWARKHAAELVGTGSNEEYSISKATREMLRTDIADAVKNGIGRKELQDLIVENYAFSAKRAEVIARTELSRAYMQGQVEGWRQTDVVWGKRWLTAPDCCDACSEVSGEEVGLDEEFSNGEFGPPLHPNAVLSGSTFASYGQLQQMVGASYHGPAVTLALDFSRTDKGFELVSRDSNNAPNLVFRDSLTNKFLGLFNLCFSDLNWMPRSVVPDRIHFTIGPNHPMLTRRGFVQARFLQEGDQLLYDFRSQDSALTPRASLLGESNFKQVMTCENVFQSLLSVFDNSVIAGASNYFHGDETFIYGEVKVVRPTRKLLPILDPLGIEKLCECNLMRTYPDAEHVAGCRSCQLRFESVFLSPPSGMCSVRVAMCHIDSFHGYAFDASTQHQLYNSGGLVVKNCRCDLAGVLLDEEKVDKKVKIRHVHIEKEWSAPTSATSGIQGYDLEGQKKKKKKRLDLILNLKPTIITLSKFLKAYSPDQPREPAGSSVGGQWASTGQGWQHTPKGYIRTKEKLQPDGFYMKDGKWMKGDKLATKAEAEQLKYLHIPPGAKDVRLNPDPNATVAAKYMNTNGNVQGASNPDKAAANAAEKFNRARDFAKVKQSLENQALKDMNNKNLSASVRDAAAANYVMSISGLRVGSTDAKLGAVKTYGISNLRTYHVELDTVDNTKVNFDFVGKKGTAVDKTVYSKPLADYLDSKTYGNKNDKIFSATSYAGISSYMSSMQGANGFTPKDYRTWHGTTTALATITDYNSKYEPPATLKEFKTYQKEVGMTVAKQLGHKNAAKEAATAIKYYIDPVVWTPWQMGIKK